MLREARKATPEALKLPKRQPLDAAVDTCLTTTFLHSLTHRRVHSQEFY